MAEQPQIQDRAGLRESRLLLFKSLDSTNQWALEHVAELHDGDVVRAVRQTAGRGRLGRHWIAPDDRALTMSALIKALPNACPPAALTQAAAVAVRDALATYGLTCTLKWPNDVFVLDYKICGILAEADPRGEGVVIGIGLNVNLTDGDFSGITLDQPATSMTLERGDVFDIAAVCARVTACLQGQVDRLSTQGHAAILADWATSDWLAGFRVRVRQDAQTIEGHYDGLTPDGRMRVIDESGTPHSILSGDVERLMPD